MGWDDPEALAKMAEAEQEPPQQMTLDQLFQEVEQQAKFCRSERSRELYLVIVPHLHQAAIEVRRLVAQHVNREIADAGSRTADAFLDMAEPLIAGCTLAAQFCVPTGLERDARYLLLDDLVRAVKALDQIEDEAKGKKLN